MFIITVMPIAYGGFKYKSQELVKNKCCFYIY